MQKLANLPRAVERYYAELRASDYRYPIEEKKCWDRLVSDTRMVDVYKALNLSEEGWRVFFGAAIDCAAVNFKALRERRAEAFRLLEPLRQHATKLAETLREFEEVSTEFESEGDDDTDLLPLRDFFALLDMEAKGRSWSWAPVRKVLKELPDSVLDRGLPSLPELLEALAVRAAAVLQLKNNPAALLAGHPVLDSALAGRQWSGLHKTYCDAFLARVKMDEHFLGRIHLPDKELAMLASVALDVNVDAETVKKRSQRKRTP